MATAIPKKICFLCDKLKVPYLCPGCSKQFCFDDLQKHRTYIKQEFDQLHNNHDLIREQIDDLKTDPIKHPFIEQIDRWENDSINKIRETAQQCRMKWIQYLTSFLRQKENILNDLAKQMNEIHQENDFNELDLNRLKGNLEKLEEQLKQPTNVSVKQQSTSFINKIYLLVSLQIDTRWRQPAATIAGRNGRGNQLDQLDYPTGICVDDQNHLIYIADSENHRIIQWKLDADNGRIVVGGKGQGNQFDQLNEPTDVIIDRRDNTLIIADFGNRRVMKWSRQSNSLPQMIINNIDCARLAMHKDGTLYVSDHKKHAIRQWKIGEPHGTTVASGNGQGNRLNQLDSPISFFIDDDHNLYISDWNNHRVVKWIKDAKEGIVVAGGNGQGDQLTQLSYPQGVIADQYGQIYVADFYNDRVMRWCEGENQGRIVVGGNGQGQQLNQLNNPIGLSFDGEGNLYVVDRRNHRIQKFERDFD